MKTISAAALLALAAFRPAGAAAPQKETLPFIENDYGRALSEAKSKKLPIFADAWAPW